VVWLIDLVILTGVEDWPGALVGGDCDTFACGAGSFPTDRLMIASAAIPDSGNNPFSIGSFRRSFERLILASIQPDDTHRLTKQLLVELETVRAEKLAAIVDFSLRSTGTPRQKAGPNVNYQRLPK
jgi:hypothetical protein